MLSQKDRVNGAFALIDAGRPPAEANGTTVRIGLLGRGIGSSLTPVMHEAEGRRNGFDYRYDLIDFDRLGLEDGDLDAVLAGARARSFWGVNVTYPFKQAILNNLDDLAPEAGAIGAVNTVVLRGGACRGYNTDCWGFAQSVRTGLGDVQLDHVVQIGAGGAGAASAHALVQLGARSVDIVDMDPNKAQQLAANVTRTTDARVQALVPAQLADAISLATGVVNATPVGMEKYPGVPFDPALLNQRQWVADLVYFPRQTELLRRAAELGCRTLPGGGMAIYQAVRAFQLFTGVKPDSTAMGRTFAAYA